MTKPKTVIAILMSLALVFVMTACSPKAETEPEEEPQTETGQETTEDSGDYDIASNLQLAGGGDEKAIDTDHFTITLTHGSSWDYTVDSRTSIDLQCRSQRSLRATASLARRTERCMLLNIRQMFSSTRQMKRRRQTIRRYTRK